MADRSPSRSPRASAVPPRVLAPAGRSPSDGRAVPPRTTSVHPLRVAGGRKGSLAERTFLSSCSVLFDDERVDAVLVVHLAAGHRRVEHAHRAHLVLRPLLVLVVV